MSVKRGPKGTWNAKQILLGAQRRKKRAAPQKGASGNTGYGSCRPKIELAIIVHEYINKQEEQMMFPVIITVV